MPESTDSPREEWRREGSRAVRRFTKVPWTERLQYVSKYLGWSGAGSRQPASYPGAEGLVATAVIIKPIGSKQSSGGGDVDTLPSHEWCEIEVQYETPEYNGKTDENQTGTGEQVLFRERLSISSEVVVAPTGSLKHPSGAAVYNSAGVQIGTLSRDHGIDMQPGIPVGVMEYTLEILYHPNPPWSAIQDAIGAINSTTFAPGTFSFARGTLLFRGVEYSQQVSVQDGVIVRSVTNYALQFSYRRVPWNMRYRAKSRFDTDPAGWCEVTSQDGDPVLPFKDFWSLI